MKKINLPKRRLLAHYAVRTSQTQEDSGTLCRLLKTFYPEEFYDIPWTGRALVAVKNPDTYPNERSIKGPCPKKKNSNNNNVPAAAGTYQHFGIAKGILGTSIGVVHWHQHVTQLRYIHLICPELLPQEFIDAMAPRKGDEFEDSIRSIWNGFRSFASEQEPVEVRIHVNIDGVKWQNNSKSKGVPILGRIHSISNSKYCIKIPLSKCGMKPFVIGVLKQDQKIFVWDFVADFIQELRELQEPTDERRFSVVLDCMICDAPQRSELKGKYILFVI